MKGSVEIIVEKVLPHKFDGSTKSKIWHPGRENTKKNTDNFY